MAEKRKDNKGRLLRDGESQRKDGKYEYKYLDPKGNRHSIYSWKLVETDKTPAGKKEGPALRELKKKIDRDREDGICCYDANKVTLNQYFDAYMQIKQELKGSTRAQYIMRYNRHIRNGLGEKKLASITFSMVKQLYVSLAHEKNMKLRSINQIHCILNPLFKTAERDNLIRKNPLTGVMAELKRTNPKTGEKRRALTEEEQEIFVEYLKRSKKSTYWAPFFTVMLGTGCRIGEIAGLRWEDCDFDANTISINHSLGYYKENGTQKKTYHISSPKTAAGVRVIPMLSDVRRALLQERVRQMKEGFSDKVVDGYSGFVFTGKQGALINSEYMFRTIDVIVKRYNREELEAAKKERREPKLLPHFTAHNIRHTFCTRFCENEMNIKVIQEIMGHANISTTMNIYNEATMKKKKEGFENLEGKIKIS